MRRHDCAKGNRMALHEFPANLAVRQRTYLPPTCSHLRWPLQLPELPPAQSSPRRTPGASGFPVLLQNLRRWIAAFATMTEGVPSPRRRPGASGFPMPLQKSKTLDCGVRHNDNLSVSPAQAGGQWLSPASKNSQCSAGNLSSGNKLSP